MGKGRPPEANAQRRGGAQPVAVEFIGNTEPAIAPSKLIKPAHVAENALQSECWDNLIATSANFAPCDVPLLESYCFWYAVLRQAEANTLAPGGGVYTVVGKVDEEGNAVPGTTAPNPELRNAEKATTMLRQLGDALNLTPTARDRAGLMRAMTKSTQADVIRKTLDGYEQFKAAQKALNAAK